MTLIKFDHDALFRKALENPLVAKEFLNNHLSADIKDIVDLNTIKIEKESFVEPKLKRSICDVLFSAKFNENQDGYIYCLLEQQSTPDYWISFRLLKYMTNIWDRYLSHNPKTKHLPIIWPCVLYNGLKPYEVSEDLWGLFHNQELSRKIFIEGYKLINLQKVPDDEIRKNLWSGMLEFFLKHSKKRDLLKVWEEIVGNLPEIVKVNNGTDYVTIFLAYTLTHMSENDTMTLKNLLTTNLEEKAGDKLMVTFAEKWYEEGIQKGLHEGIQKGLHDGIQKGLHDGIQKGLHDGIQKGKLETAQNLLKADVSIELIRQATGLSIQEISKLKKK